MSIGGRQVEAADRYPKIRGIRRHLQYVQRLPVWFETQPFPEPFKGCSYWHYKLPVHRALVEGPQARPRIIQTCMRSLLHAVQVLQRKKRESSVKQARIFAQFSYPAFHSSSLEIFFDEKYFRDFFERTLTDDKWLPFARQEWHRLPSARSILKEHRLCSEFVMTEQGYNTRTIYEPLDPGQKVCESYGETWFIGEWD